jgi:hypothetical protein
MMQRMEMDKTSRLIREQMTFADNSQTIEEIRIIQAL